MPAKLISGDINEHDARHFQNALAETGIDRVDTAALYGMGESEKKIGNSDLAKTFTIDTKVLFIPPGDNTLTSEAVEKSVSNSLRSLGVDKVNVLYCHGADFKTPIAEQAKTFHEQYQQGRFKYLGVSNFPPTMLEQWLDISAKESYVKPSVFQGQYNLLCRGYETTLFPLLRKHSIQFNAYSPLAGGFVLGNFTPEGIQGGERFAKPSPFTFWYDKPGMHEAIRQLRKISSDEGIDMDELNVRWLFHSSILNDEDGVILGWSKSQQLSKNVGQIKKGPLSESVVKQMNELWGLCKDDGNRIIAGFEEPFYFP